MPTTAGAGTQASPQNVLIIITDGAADNTTDNASSGQSTYFTATNVAQCNAIKATGTRIAILYTQYLPETIDYTGKTSFNAFAANQTVCPRSRPSFRPAPARMPMVPIPCRPFRPTAALNTLFAMSVQTARLVQ